MRTQIAVLVAFFVSTLFPCIAVSQPAQPTLKLTILSGRPVVEGVYLNGQGPYRFLLDTGSQTNQLEAGLARKLGLATTFQRDLYTPSGHSHVQGGKVSQVALGSAHAENQDFLFTNFDGIHALSSDIRGILGQGFLSHFDYTLDFKHHLLTFGNPPASGTHIPVRMAYGRMLVATSQGELVLDSGTDTVFLFRKSLRPANAHISSASGLAANVTIENAPDLRIGDRVYHPMQAQFQEVADAPEGGLLPASLFHAVFVSNSEGYVVFDPEAR
jgi:hypothetical protein